MVERTLPTTDTVNERIVLELLNSVEQDGARSQRLIAGELGVALGLVNAYLKRCIKKGLVKVQDVPARRYAYYLTPQGFAEKSRLTVQYLSDSFSFFRIAKADCVHAFEVAKANGWTRLALAGKSDLAEIAILCAMEAKVTIAAIVDPRSDATQFVGVNIVKSYKDVCDKFDAVVVTDVTGTGQSFDMAVEACGSDRVLVPGLLGLHSATRAGNIA
jgi:DNA-binding MarR family transcriptional regulator